MKIVRIRFCPKNTHFRLFPKLIENDFNCLYLYKTYSFMCFRITFKERWNY